MSIAELTAAALARAATSNGTAAGSTAQSASSKRTAEEDDLLRRLAHFTLGQVSPMARRAYDATAFVILIEGDELNNELYEAKEKWFKKSSRAC